MRSSDWSSDVCSSDLFGGFELAGIVHPPVTDTFVGEFELSVGNKRVRLVDVGPAHTASDVLVHVPEDRVVYTGDILFNGGHPAIWAGPVGTWIKAFDTILDWNVAVIVPGHGPIREKDVVRTFTDPPPDSQEMRRGGKKR